MSPIRIVILAIAAVVAIGLALLVRTMVSRPAPPPPAAVAVAKPMAQVVVAHADLPVGHRLAAGDLTWQPWPVEALNPAYITDGHGAQAPAPTGTGAVVVNKVAGAARDARAAVTGQTSPMDALYGAIVREPILANEPVVNNKLVRAGVSSYMSVVLSPGMRALAIPIKDTSAVGGFILPGDRVDVLETMQANANGGGGIVAKTVVRNVRVLAIDQTTQADKKNSIAGNTATLEVPAEDVEALAVAKQQDNMVLVLRSYADTAGPPSRVIQASGPTNSVRIFRDGQASDVTVTQ